MLSFRNIEGQYIIYAKHNGWHSFFIEYASKVWENRYPLDGAIHPQYMYNWPLAPFEKPVTEFRSSDSFLIFEDTNHTVMRPEAYIDQWTK